MSFFSYSAILSWLEQNPNCKIPDVKFQIPNSILAVICS